jgi:hypothetical protein
MAEPRKKPPSPSASPSTCIGQASKTARPDRVFGDASAPGLRWVLPEDLKISRALGTTSFCLPDFFRHFDVSGIAETWMRA